MTAENKVVICLSAWVTALMIGGMLLVSSFPGLHTTALALQETGGDNSRSVLAMLKDDSQLLQISAEYAEQKKHQLRLEIPSTVDFRSISVDNDYMNRLITITIPGIGETYFYDYPMIGSADGIVDLRYNVTEGGGSIEIGMETIYECITTEKDRFLYVDFVTPHEKYDYVVAIDAGHGGRDVGANNGEIFEKDLNLAIVQQLAQLFEADAHNVGVYYTRTEDVNPGLSERVELANTVQADAFVSVHINSTSSGRESGIHGTSVLYLVADHTEASKNLAQNCLDGMLGQLGSLSKGLVAGDDIKIIRLSEVPVALCEVGFVSNPEERALLCTEDYQRKAATGIYQGILKTLGLQ